MLKIYDALNRNDKIIPTYIWVTDSKPRKYWETRDIKKEEQLSIANGTFANNIRNITDFLEDWDPIKKRLGII